MDSLHTRLRGRILARRWPVLPVSVTISATLALCLLVALLFGSSLVAKAQEDKQGDVIVQFDDHAQVVRSFTFTGEISGLDALTLSGLDVVTTSTSFGPAVCSIAGVGCPAADCFCSTTKYWAYNYWDGAAWQGYPVGAGCVSDQPDRRGRRLALGRVRHAAGAGTVLRLRPRLLFAGWRRARL